jgi:glycopeptide antibiotics resistance protein
VAIPGPAPARRADTKGVSIPLTETGSFRVLTDSHPALRDDSKRDERVWSRAADRTGEKLGAATLGYVAATTLLITLAPFRFSLSELHGLSTEWTVFDLVMNVVMFAPLGFLYRMTRPRGASNAWWMAIALGAALSTCIETAQLFEASRYSSLIDIATNTLGAAVGSALYTRLSHRLRVGAATVSTLALELPLMGLVYLLIPLMWLTGLASSGTERAWMLLLLGAFGGAIIGAVHGAYLEPSQRVGARGLVSSSAAWYLIASLPGGRAQPIVMLFGLIVTVGTAWLRSVATSRARLRQGPYRFELPTLRLVMPLFAVYLGFSALWPIDAASSTWTGAWELFPALNGEISQRLLFGALEYTAAFTVAGYMTAEFHGRSNRDPRAVMKRVAGYGVVLVVLLECARGWHAELGASVSLGGLALAASIFGGWLYHLQRDHVRALWARDKGSRESRTAAA